MLDKVTAECRSNHLTSFGVEEYTGNGIDPNSVKPEDKIKDLVVEEASVKTADRAFCLWASVCSFVILVLYSVWGFFKDRRDERNYEYIRDPANKLLVGLYLLPKVDKKKKQKLPPKEIEPEFEEPPPPPPVEVAPPPP